MSQLGELLRNMRESKGISLSQAAAETRILQRYLVALEEGDYLNLPGDVYARGFIRNYARFLGVSPEDALQLYRQERGRSEPIRVVQTASAPRARNFFVPSFFGVFFVVLILVGVSYLVLNITSNMGGSLAQGTTQPTSAPPPPPLPTALPEPSVTPVLAQVNPTQQIAGMALTPTSVTAPLPSPTLEAPIVLEVRTESGANPGSWLEIRTDGQSVYRKVLPSGQSLRFTAQRNVWVRAGNASVVSLIINGQPQPPLSTTANEVVTFSWPP